MSEREFSILGQRQGTWLKAIPWSILAPHEQQARHNHGQSLERLQARGGLSPQEALHVIKDIAWHYSNPESERIRHLSLADANAELTAIVESRIVAPTAVPCQHGPRPEQVDARGIQKCPRCGELINAA